MNQLEYKILSYINIKKGNTQNLNTEKYWNDFYEISSIENQDKILITYQEFETIITEIYNTLILKLSPITVNKVLDHYLTLLLSDIILNKQKITTIHCLKNIYYIASFNPKKTTKIYADDILFIQNNLYQKLNIQETKMQKFKRKSRIKILTNI